MDQNLVVDPFYLDRMRESLLSIPSVSIVTDSEHLFGPSGIHVNRLDTGLESERLISFELLGSDDHASFQINAGVRIVGNATRGSSPKQNFRIVFRNKFGPRRLQERVFPDSPVESFNQLILRTNMKDSWINDDATSLRRATYMRDAWLRESLTDTGQITTHGFFVHLYLNGLYWGVYDLHERPDSAFAVEYFGGEKEDYDVIKNHEEVLDGSVDAYREFDTLRQGNLRDDAAYSEILAFVDVENISDYMMVNMFGPATDWPANFIMLRDRVRAVGFRFFSWDGDLAFREGVLANRTVPHPDDVDSPTKFHHALRANAEYRLSFADRLRRNFFEQGAMTREAALARWEWLADRLEPALVAESARWSSYRPFGPFRPDVEWRAVVDELARSYLSLRRDITLEQFRQQGLFPALSAPRLDRPASGEPLESLEPWAMVSILARDATVYYTLDGSDPRLHGGAVNPTAFTGATGERSVLIAPGSLARVWVPRDGHLGESWTASDFDDSAWLSGTTGLGFGAGYASLVGLDLGAEMKDLQSSLYARLPFDLDDPRSVAALELSLRVDDGFVAYLNGVLVAELNAPRDLRWNSVAPENLPSGTAMMEQRFDLSEHLGLLTAGRNVLAVHGLNSDRGSGAADFLVLPELIATLRNETLVRLGDTTQLKARSFDGSTWSALVEQTYQINRPRPLRITEIQYHAAEAPEGSGFEDRDFDFLEIQNVGTDRLSLLGVRLEGGVQFDFSKSERTELDGGEVILLVANRQAFDTRHDGADLDILGEYDGNLSNNHETLRLSDGIGRTILEFDYDDEWYPVTDGTGLSLVVVDPLEATARWRSPENWRPSAMPGGSPGLVEMSLPAGLRLPGDANADGRLNLADALTLVEQFAGRSSRPLPCADDPGDPRTRAVVDVNADGRVNLADPIYLLNYLFRRGPGPMFGRGCVTVRGCEELCSG